MKKAIALGLTALAFVLGACGGSEDEKTESSTDKLSMACMQAINPNTPDLWNEFQRCIDAPDDFFGPNGFPGQQNPQPNPGANKPGPNVPQQPNFPGGGGGCSVSVSCVNGSCTCGSGPKQGTHCDGSQLSGANSCNVVCRSGC
jgi:hypothetical protein